MITINLDKLAKELTDNKGKNFIHNGITILQVPNGSISYPGYFVKLIIGGVTVSLGHPAVGLQPGDLKQPVKDVIAKLILEVETSKLLDGCQKFINDDSISKSKQSFIDPYGYEHILVLGESLDYNVISSEGKKIVSLSGDFKMMGTDLLANMFISAIRTRFQTNPPVNEVELDEEWCLNNAKGYDCVTTPNGIFLHEGMGYGQQPFNNGVGYNHPTVFNPQGQCYNPNSNVQQVGRPSQFQPY